MAMIAAVLMPLVLHATSLEGTWQYRAINEKGRVIASGPITFRGASYKALPRGEQAWRSFGTRKIREVDGSQYGPHGEQGDGAPATVGATVEADGTFRADMNLGWHDNNVILVGQRKGKRIEGTWTWNTFTGPRTKGRFTLTKVR